MRIVPYILATAGHVDHGKSALVRALTGIDPDRLPEEKARGITIDLGFAHVDLPSPGASDVFRVGIVDVPGHEDFVKNMVAGVGSIDAALIVVAADDGWMPQTEEHVQILTYLGVSCAVVALSKVDLVDSEEPARKQITEKLAATPFANAPVVGTVATTGKGTDELKAALTGALADIPAQRDIGKPRLSVDRAFTLRGIGTVVTGTLTGGVLTRGQHVVVQPSGAAGRIRSIQCYSQEVEQAGPGLRVALNLPDLEVAEHSQAKASIGRGDVITLPGLGRASDTIDVILEISVRSAQGRPIKEATLVRFHHGSANTPAFVYFHGASSLSAGQSVPAQLRLESPIFAFAGDRFILRDWSEQQTIAGGIVLDPHASRRGFRTEQRRAFLDARARRPSDVLTFVRTELEREGAAPATQLLVHARFSAPEIAGAIATLVAQQEATAHGPVVANARWWASLRARALDAIDQAHQSNPQEPGFRLTDLRHALAKHMGRADVFDPLVADLCAAECARTGVVIRRADYRPVLPAKLQAAGATIRTLLTQRKLDPPARKELAADSLSQQALRFLVQNGEAVEIGPEMVLAAEHYHAALQAVRTFLLRRGSATVSELKQALNTSRRIMVPLLEKLDRDGITLRQGDKRTLRSPK